MIKSVFLLFSISVATSGFPNYPWQEEENRCWQCKPSHPNCCEYDAHLDIDPVVMGANICPRIISDTDIDIHDGDDFYLYCSLDSICINTCTWMLPNGRSCHFNDKTPQGSSCGDIELVGDFSIGSCDIKVSNANQHHDGTWRCLPAADKLLSDTVNITITDGLKRESIIQIAPRFH